MNTVMTDVQPFFVFQRMDLRTCFRALFSYLVPNEYTYLLRRLHCKYPSNNAPVFPNPPTTSYNDLRIEFFNSGNIIARQDVPLPVALLSTPSRNGVSAFTEAAPFDAKAFSINMTSASPKRTPELNFLYRGNDNIEIHITGQTGGTPEFIDILCEGYMWKDGIFNA